jgi:Ca-activated chloride channel family protein
MKHWQASAHRIGYPLLLGALLLPWGSATAQRHAPAHEVLLIFDASRSMSAPYKGGTRLSAAKQLLYELTDSLSRYADVHLALRTYGSVVAYPPGDCADSHLAVPFGPANGQAIKDTVSGYQPTGITPIAKSLVQAPADFTLNADEKVIILITDGIEECDQDPCAAARKLRDAGIVLRPFIIGVGIERQSAKAFDCVGPYFDVADFASVGKLVQQVVSEALHETTAQINLLGAAYTPSTTDVPIVLQDRRTDAPCYAFVHTLNQRGYPDTLRFDPFPDYRITAYTVPPVLLDTARHRLGTHNTFTLLAPVGTLELMQGSRGAVEGTTCLVREHNKPLTLNVQPVNSTQRYLAGTYDLEFLTLPRVTITDVKVQDQQTNRVAIPPSGHVHVVLPSPGVASILVEAGEELQLVVTLADGAVDDHVDLQPGDYHLLYRAAEEHRTIYGVDRPFTVESNVPQTVDLAH